MGITAGQHSSSWLQFKSPICFWIGYRKQTCCACYVSLVHTGLGSGATCASWNLCLNSCRMCTWLAICKCVELICHPTSKVCVKARDTEGKETSVQNQARPPAKWPRTLLLAGSRVGKWTSAGNVLSRDAGIGGICPWRGGGSPYILRAGHIWGSRLAPVDGSLSSPGFNDSWCRKKWPYNGHSMFGKGKATKAALLRWRDSQWAVGTWAIELPSAGQPEYIHTSTPQKRKTAFWRQLECLLIIW